MRVIPLAKRFEPTSVDVMTGQEPDLGVDHATFARVCNHPANAGHQTMLVVDQHYCAVGGQHG